jgi:hypothetical protein
MFEFTNLDKVRIYNKSKPKDNIKIIIDDLPINILMQISKRICPTDFTSQIFNNIFHNYCYRKKENIIELTENHKEKLKSSILKSYNTGAFDHRDQANDIINNFLESEVEKEQSFNTFVEEIKIMLDEKKEKLQKDFLEVLDFDLYYQNRTVICFDKNRQKYCSYYYDGDGIFEYEDDICYAIV